MDGVVVVEVDVSDFMLSEVDDAEPPLPELAKVVFLDNIDPGMLLPLPLFCCCLLLAIVQLVDLCTALVDACFFYEGCLVSLPVGERVNFGIFLRI